MFQYAVALMIFATASSVFAADLQFQIRNVRSSTGSVLVTVFDRADGFPDSPDRAVKAVKLKAKQGTMSLRFSSLPPGGYSIAFFHDENENGKLDTNFVGMPKEGFGFSNDPRISFGAPSYADCRIEVKAPQTSSAATLKYY